MQSSYVRVSIDDFMTGGAAGLDLYIKLNDDHFTKVANGAEGIGPGRLTELKSRGVRHLYALKDAFTEYMKRLQVVMVDAAANSEVAADVKAALVGKVMSMVHSIAFSKFLDRNLLVTSLGTVETACLLLADQEVTAKLLKSLESHSDREYAHAMAVSIYSMMIAKSGGRSATWYSGQSLIKLSVAALFHDIGMVSLSEEWRRIEPSKMLEEQRAHYETHPEKGAEILSAAGCFSNEIIQAVRHHHENCLGSGFPRRLTKSRIQPMARLIAVADAFVWRLSQCQNDPQEAIRLLIVNDCDALDKECLDCLIRANGYAVESFGPTAHGLYIRKIAA